MGKTTAKFDHMFQERRTIISGIKGKTNHGTGKYFTLSDIEAKEHFQPSAICPASCARDCGHSTQKHFSRMGE
jgi:hypothetical protein